MSPVETVIMAALSFIVPAAGVTSAILYDRKVTARKLASRRAAWEQLCAKFGQEFAERIQRGEIWQGETLEMVLHTFGRPEAVDEKVTKTITRHVLKWGRRPGNRFALRITIESDVVVGWER